MALHVEHRRSFASGIGLAIHNSIYYIILTFLQITFISGKHVDLGPTNSLSFGRAFDLDLRIRS